MHSVFKLLVMKFVIVFLSLVAFGFSTPLMDITNPKIFKIAIGDDGTITIDAWTGTRVFITRNPEHKGPRNIEIFSESTTNPMKRIWMDQETAVELIDSQYWGGQTEADILVAIFKKWEGTIDTALYEALLRRIMICIQNGHINMVVYKVLKCINFEYGSLEQCVSISSSLDIVRPRYWSILRRLGMKVPVHQQMFGDNIVMTDERRDTFGQDNMGAAHPVIRNWPSLIQTVPDVTTVDRPGFMVQSVPRDFVY